MISSAGAGRRAPGAPSANPSRIRHASHRANPPITSLYPHPTHTMPPPQPELKKYLDKRLFVQLNGSRKVIGVLRGYDVFLNIVLDEAVEERAGGEKVRIGMVVIRGNSVVMLEALERIGGGDRGGDRDRG
ncbi:small nuclear ribonucleoprotein g [Lasallia pustulata]|nr:small nuclear ribonucleoprotein g [Lasallia pustulata]